MQCPFNVTQQSFTMCLMAFWSQYFSVSAAISHECLHSKLAGLLPCWIPLHGPNFPTWSWTFYLIFVIKTQHSGWKNSIDWAWRQDPEPESHLTHLPRDPRSREISNSAVFQAAKQLRFAPALTARELNHVYDHIDCTRLITVPAARLYLWD